MFETVLVCKFEDHRWFPSNHAKKSAESHVPVIPELGR